MPVSTLDILTPAELDILAETPQNKQKAPSEIKEQDKETAIIKVKPVYEITGGSCQCLGFIQYKLDEFDSASYMDMLSDPATMQTIKQIYYQQKEPRDDLEIIEHNELPLEY